MEAINNIGREEVGYEYFDWPKTTTDSDKGREWIHLKPPLYYLHQICDSPVNEPSEEGKWIVVDRIYDCRVTRPYARKSDCIRAFIKEHSEQ